MCKKLNDAIESATTIVARKSHYRRYRAHKALHFNKRLQYEKRKINSKVSTTRIMSIAMDGTDGIGFPNFSRTPKSLTRIPKFDLHTMGTRH
jgi:hypothetical protein